MSALESLTVGQLAALCGLTRRERHWWVSTATRKCTDPGWASVSQNADTGEWEVGIYPYAPLDLSPGQRVTEHAALVALAKHLNLTPKEDTVPKYKRIEKDPKLKDYGDYTPQAGDVWCFHDGQKWPVTWTDACGLSVGPTADVVYISPAFLPVRSLTTHIERPVEVRDVRGPDYEPKPGDVLCGPDGPLFVVSYVPPSSGPPCVTPVGRSVPKVGLAVEHFALCTRIEREE